MLKGIPKILSPELLKVLCEMGHSDRLVIADGNFPCESMGKDAIVIRCDGHGVPEILDAILEVFPLDTYIEKPVNLMELMPCDVGKIDTPIWDTYKEIVKKHDERGEAAVGNIERFAFYDEAKTAYAIIATGESAVYANVMLQKGVVKQQFFGLEERLCVMGSLFGSGDFRQGSVKRKWAGFEGNPSNSVRFLSLRLNSVL